MGDWMFKRAAAWSAIAAATLLLGDNLDAQILSSRAITIIIPFTPGASSDILQRLVAKKVTKKPARCSSSIRGPAEAARSPR